MAPPARGRGGKSRPAPERGEPEPGARASRSGESRGGGTDRKRKAEAAIQEELKKSAVLPDSGSPLELRWEWQADGGVWHMYSQESNKAITEAFRAGKSMVTISPSANVKLRVDLKKMVQKNVQTGFERPICAVAGSQDHYFAWQWEADDGSWELYCPETTLELETAHQANEKSISVIFGKVSYTLNMGKMVQINNNTQFERKMERRESAAVEFDASSQSNGISTEEASGAKKPRATEKKPVKGKKVAAVADVATGGRDKIKTEKGDDKGSVKTLVLNGKAPVDPECTAKLSKAHVYWEGDDIYDVMLNQTNLQFNNNKYYLIQLLEDDNQKSYSVWMRWGRVGKVGQNSLVTCGADLGKAKKIFEKKFLDKTENDWDCRDFFEKVPGKYDLLKMDYKMNEERSKALKVETEVDSGLPKMASKLDTRIQDLLELICNIQAMEERIVEMKYDTKKAPLGKLTLEQIKAGYKSLKRIEDCIKKNQSGRHLVEACNEFYTRIPHDFGLKTPPMISTMEALKEKMLLLEALGDIEIAIKLVKKEVNSLEHPLDQQYRNLHCKVQPLDHNSPEYKLIDKYLQTTHASTHNDYTMTLLDVFEIEKEGEKTSFRDDITNRLLLWHGSRLTNWVGILSRGLCVAPPEAPVTGYMFGKGIYFADMSSKSGNYCFATRQKDIGLLLLSEVAIGDSNKLLQADYEAEKQLKGKQSTMGLGRVAPDPANRTELNGLAVPLGPAKETGVVNPNGYTLNYNEYIVYNSNQVRMKYLLKVRFNFTQLW